MGRDVDARHVGRRRGIAYAGQRDGQDSGDAKKPEDESFDVDAGRKLVGT